MPARSVPTVPIGLVSVMPQPCSTSTPCFCSKSRIMLSGTAEPPTSVRFSVFSFTPLWSR